MRAALRDLRVLWDTRHTSGFPTPTYRVMGGRVSVRKIVLGTDPWVCTPLWRQVVDIPFRPWRYAKMVREIARTRNKPYAPHVTDSVP